MSKRKPLIDASGEVRELTAEDLKHFRPAHEVLPEELQKLLGVRKPGRPLGSGKTEQISIRVPVEALEKWRASGKGWQTRAAQLLTRNAPK
jgi:uncharacterized protein (DUF4415 family)